MAKWMGRVLGNVIAILVATRLWEQGVKWAPIARADTTAYRPWLIALVVVAFVAAVIAAVVAASNIMEMLVVAFPQRMQGVLRISSFVACLFIITTQPQWVAFWQFEDHVVPHMTGQMVLTLCLMLPLLRTIATSRLFWMGVGMLVATSAAANVRASRRKEARDKERRRDAY